MLWAPRHKIREVYASVQPSISSSCRSAEVSHGKRCGHAYIRGPRPEVGHEERPHELQPMEGRAKIGMGIGFYAGAISWAT